MVFNNCDRERRDRSPLRIPSRQGRIKRNRRPSYAYANPSDLQVIQPRYPMSRPLYHQPAQRAHA